MTRPNLLIFDDGLGRWGPLLDRRPVFDLRTGAVTIRQRIERTLGCQAQALRVPARLSAVCREREDAASPAAINRPLASGIWLAVNGRWNGVQHGDLVAQLAPGHALVEADGDLVALCLDAEPLNAWLETGNWTLPGSVTRTSLPDRVLMGRPWHVFDELNAALVADLAACDLPQLEPGRHPGVHVIGDHPVYLGEGARLLPGVVLNAERGSVAIDVHALVHPFTMIEGPVYVGRRSILAAHTALRPNTVIGPECKVGGEISASIVHGRTNKAHLGYLGNSLVGEWCNLGADTNVSNLKNTYGPIRIQLNPDTPPEDTGHSHLGPILGDFVRTAIGTRILTGAVVGTGAMLATPGYAPKCCPAFAFHTDKGAQPTDLDRFLATVRRILAQRDEPLTDAEAHLLRTLHTVATTQPA